MAKVICRYFSVWRFNINSMGIDTVCRVEKCFCIKNKPAAAAKAINDTFNPYEKHHAEDGRRLTKIQDMVTRLLQRRLGIEIGSEFTLPSPSSDYMFCGYRHAFRKSDFNISDLKFHMLGHENKLKVKRKKLWCCYQ